MAIEFNCPHCGRLLTTSDERALAQAKCPACNELITVPARPLAGAVAAPGLFGTGSAASGLAPPDLAATAAWAGSAVPDNGDRDTASPAHAAVSSGSDSEPDRPSPVLDGALSPSSPVPSSPAAPSPLPPRSTGEPMGSRPRLTAACPECGAEAGAGSIYCPMCGAPLLAPVRGLHYAEFWRRVAAALIDAAIIGVAAQAVQFAVPLGIWNEDRLAFVLWFLYHSALEGSPEQATLGKRILRIVVCDSEGRRLSYPRATIRTLAKILSAMICGVGYIMPLLTPRKQALHDVLTDAIVVRRIA